MVQLKRLRIPPEQQLRALKWDWMLGKDTMEYITEDVVVVNKTEAEQYYEAVEQLYNMYIMAAQRIIDHNEFHKLGIPENMVRLIKHTWNDDRNLHLYGRFDLRGGIDGRSIKLIEFNADTPTCIPETAIVQYAHLKANDLNESMQFNTVYESLVENFRRLLTLHPEKSPFLLLSAMEGYPEDDSNVSVLGEAAKEAGFEIAYAPIHQVEFSHDEGIFLEDENGNYHKYDFWFKLIPWEFIAQDEPQLMDILSEIVINDLAVVLNPAYTILFQSKGILKTLWDIYPYHPLLLETSSQPLNYKSQVEKVFFGREGANVKIIDPQGKVVEEVEGDYGLQQKIFQEYVEFPKDQENRYYQAGVFYAYEGCGLGFRRGGKILENQAQFTGHIIE